MSYGTHDLLVRGIAAAKAKEMAEARRYLEWALSTDADPDQKIEIWWWLSEISTDPGEQRKLMEDILANRPTESRARRRIAILDGRLKPEEIIDPGHLPAPVPAERAVNVDRFTCPKCGGRMTYTPDGQSLTCEYCETQQNLKRSQFVDVEEQDFVLALSTARGHQAPAAFQTFLCQGCGTSFLLSASDLTLTCPYCDSAYVVRQEQKSEFITPGGVVPFKIDKNHAVKAIRDWLHNSFSEKNVQVGRGTALYLPAWTFDIGGELNWRGYKQQNRREQAKLEAISGSQPVLINDLIIPATMHLSKTCQAELLQFDLSALVPYDDRFLANWPAETYQVSAADASLEARRLALQRGQAELRASLDQPVNDLVILPAGLAVESFRLVLLPVWLTHFTFEERRYEGVINGHSGSVRAEKPANIVARWLGLG
jgi:DNA-directed RNA polymerase subunit RPC12/RpoP